jgi:hypothetical protein
VKVNRTTQSEGRKRKGLEESISAPTRS